MGSLKVERLNDRGILPWRAHAFDAGYDLCSAEEALVPPGGRVLVGTGLAVAVPFGTYGRIAPRSGIAVKHGITTGAGVVDGQYRGEVKVLLFNHGDKAFRITPGDRIAQLILEKIETPLVEEVDRLDATERGVGGFGSTGQHSKAPYTALLC